MQLIKEGFHLKIWQIALLKALILHYKIGKNEENLHYIKHKGNSYE